MHLLLRLSGLSLCMVEVGELKAGACELAYPEATVRSADNCQ